VSNPQQPMDQLWPLTVTTPAGTLPSAPLVTPWPLADANLDYVEIIVPNGPSGQVGVAILWSGTQIIPWGNGTWIITNDEKIHIPVGSYITISGLAVQTYNEGIFPHTLYLRALVKYTTAPVVTEAPVIGSAAILGTGEETYDNSLAPAGLIGEASGEDTGISPESAAGNEGDLSALPESVS
jgi:hypothetical protein